ncbi:MAG: sugar ABC transporter permease [Thermomicrobiales bacterium]|nr:sugar ABC transporter permease [Thermomicrobiales bacterium]
MDTPGSMTSPTAPGLAAAEKPKAIPWYKSRVEKKNLRLGILFISPWIVGFLGLTLYPLLYTFYLSFTRFGGFKDPVWIGLANYQRMFNDDNFSKAMYNTFYFTFLAVPIGVVVALMLALAMDQPLPEIPLYRTLLYLPSILPLFATAFIFMTLLDPNQGIVNDFLRTLGFDPPNWFGDARYSKIAIIGMAQFGAGQMALIYLAGLKGIPTSLYEAAEIDGAGVFNRLFKITIPLMTPVILYSLISGISGGLQVFTQSFIITNGGPNNSTNFLVFYLYRNAFAYSNQMGYAAAMGVVLFVITVLMAGLIFFTSSRWVNYDMAG